MGQAAGVGSKSTHEAPNKGAPLDNQDKEPGAGKISRPSTKAAAQLLLSEGEGLDYLPSDWAASYLSLFALSASCISCTVK
jgi:hypothetical protein